MDSADHQTLKNEKSTSKYIRGSTLLFVGRLIAIFLKAFIQVIIVRYLSKADYGAFSYALNMVDMGVIFSLLALDKAASRFVPIYDEQHDYSSLFGFIILSLSTVLGIGIALALFIIGARGFLQGALNTNSLSMSLLIILIALAPLQALDNWFQSMFAAFTRVRAIFFRRYVLWPSLQLATILIVILTGSNVYWLAAGYLAGGAIGTAMYGAMLVSLLRKKGIWQQFNWNTSRLRPREIFGFSVPMFFTGIVFIIRSQFAVVFLEYFKDTIAVAEYRAVQPIVRLNSVVYGSFIFLYLPLAARMFAKEDHKGINDLYWRSTAWISIASFPVFLVTFALADPVVKLLFSEQYASSGVIMAIMAVGSYINAIMGFNKDTLRAYNIVRFLVFVDIAVMFVALASYLLFIPQFGAVGAAIAYTAAIIVNNVLYHVGLIRFTGTKIFDWSYLRVYVMILGGTLGLGLIQIAFSPPLLIGVLLAAAMSLWLLRANASRLQVGEMFPELLKVPLLGKLLS